MYYITKQQKPAFCKSAKTKHQNLFNMKEKLNEMPTKATTTTKIHESKQFPFVIIEQTETKNEIEKKKFHIGLAGAIISEKVFSNIESAEKYIESRPWDLIVGIIGRTFTIIREDEKSKS